MAEILPLTALHYDQAVAGPLDELVAPPYDVIDDDLRAELTSRSPHNVVNIDLPQTDGPEDPYAHAAQLLQQWRDEGAVVQDDTPAIWPLTQDYTGPDGRRQTRSGFLCRVRVEDYGAGRIRPHERTHPGPKQDRLDLTRATRSNLSPIFSLFSDPGNAAWAALAPHIAATATEPFATTRDPDGTVNRLWRVTDPQALEAVTDVVAKAELLIADGHHRYETARAYAEEIGGEGPHRWVLMCLVALEDPGLTVFPTHRLISGLESESGRQDALDRTIREQFDVLELPDRGSLVPEPRAGDEAVHIGYMDALGQVPYMLSLKESSNVDQLLADHSEPYRQLDTAVLEAVILKGALGMTDEQIDHRDGLDYARDFEAALDALDSEEVDAGFFMAPTPIQQVQEVAESGESMPPKSTYFFPKVPTGLVFNPLFD
ncbi:DUF1015 domain-containing protein [Conexibacter sp. CPCC 206217]|uniref:DUF1015 domain-containing protein n=1 Tax=Conexibacter sp. CPCC 206217 TaxID=3064574 RepID=UPI002717CE28|nr:DUF1015 domain-containing protein [Conexibacter sp. CPCC 206217]MDO8209119.1 DUF1015 domain-containing protein [Conexibacter sp. CPCC 206217]